jgi:galactose mutarotase-like enzyme
MNTYKTSVSDEAGFCLVHLENEYVSISVIPELGARMVSLRDKRSGREWLWRPPGPLKLWRNHLGDSFSKGTFVGVDECLPTIGACSWNGRELPDHGEVWSGSWELDRAAFTEGRINTTIRLPRSPLILSRDISLVGSALRMDYTLTNVGSRPEAWLWSWHPLFSIRSGDRLELPDEVDSLFVETARLPDAGRGEIWNWPSHADHVRLDCLELDGDHSYVKAFAGPVQSGMARLVNKQNNTRLRLRWDAATLPYLGIWLTRGGYNGWHHLALEPTNLQADTLADGAKTVQPIASTATQTWWMEVELGS